ncbi:MAG: hypothetical protein Q7R73_02480 [bacterium]|nr:hypothetical protein [bacterium]
MKIRGVFSALLLAIFISGTPESARATHIHRAETCYRIVKAETFYNASGWFLKVQLPSEAKIINDTLVINLRDEPVDIRIGYTNVVETKDTIKKVACLLTQYPDEYKNGAGYVIFVPSYYAKLEWVQTIAKAEVSYLMLQQGISNPRHYDRFSKPHDYIFPDSPRYLPDK